MRTADKKIPATPEKRKREAVVTAVRLKVRKEPSTESEVVQYLERGEHVPFYGHHDETWDQVEGGYVMTKYVTSTGD